MTLLVCFIVQRVLPSLCIAAPGLPTRLPTGCVLFCLARFSVHIPRAWIAGSGGCPSSPPLAGARRFSRCCTDLHSHKHRKWGPLAPWTHQRPVPLGSMVVTHQKSSASLCGPNVFPWWPSCWSPVTWSLLGEEPREGFCSLLCWILLLICRSYLFWIQILCYSYSLQILSVMCLLFPLNNLFWWIEILNFSVVRFISLFLLG